ncbi:hypothetical protein QFC24_001220 [Naganishia onofrii]|uniref:Uncharacterized protein n=1 Tax=Naganishia onofrii TaxID=1851511 RepID=A0ACC2XUD7_9TREE|nr:hypothetical protein QFC24_001220 [Naganishia onofrii]
MCPTPATTAVRRVAGTARSVGHLPRTYDDALLLGFSEHHLRQAAPTGALADAFTDIRDNHLNNLISTFDTNQFVPPVNLTSLETTDSSCHSQAQRVVGFAIGPVSGYTVKCALERESVVHQPNPVPLQPLATFLLLQTESLRRATVKAEAESHAHQQATFTIDVERAALENTRRIHDSEIEALRQQRELDRKLAAADLYAQQQKADADAYVADSKTLYARAASLPVLHIRLPTVTWVQAKRWIDYGSQILDILLVVLVVSWMFRQNTPLTQCAINQKLRGRLSHAHYLDEPPHAYQEERHDRQPPSTPSKFTLPASSPATNVAQSSSVKCTAFGVVPRSPANSPYSALAACQNALLDPAPQLEAATLSSGTSTIVGRLSPATATTGACTQTVNDFELVKSPWTKRSKAEKKAAKETLVKKVVPGSQAAASAFGSTSAFEEALSKALAANNLVNKSLKHSSPCLKASPTTRTSVADCPREASKQSPEPDDRPTTLVFAPYKTKEEMSGTASVLKSYAEVANVVSSSTTPTGDCAPTQPDEVTVPSPTKLVVSTQHDVDVKSVATPTIIAPTALAHPLPPKPIVTAETQAEMEEQYQALKITAFAACPMALVAFGGRLADSIQPKTEPTHLNSRLPVPANQASNRQLVNDMLKDPVHGSDPHATASSKVPVPTQSVTTSNEETMQKTRKRGSRAGKKEQKKRANASLRAEGGAEDEAGGDDDRVFETFIGSGDWSEM